MAFVGFVSWQQKEADSAVDAALQSIDGALIQELTHIPGFLGYSSLELRAGHWYNLVLLNDAETKAHLMNGETHRYAAQQLAPRYYEWIRLHSGKIEGGLIENVFVLQRTKYYKFPGGFLGLEQRSTN